MSQRRGSSTLGAVARGSGACCVSPLRHLRAGAVARSGDARCAPPYNTSSSAQGFLSSNHQDSPAATWRRLKALSQCEAWSRPLWPGGSLPPSPPSPGPSLSRCCCRQDPVTRRGGLMPAPRSSRRMTALLHAPCSSKRAPVLPLRLDVNLASVHRGQPTGWLPPAAGSGRATPIQSQRICSHAN